MDWRLFYLFLLHTLNNSIPTLVDWLAEFKQLIAHPHGIGVAAGQGGPDFWYPSVRGRPLRLLRCANPSHHQNPSRSVPMPRRIGV